MTICAVCRWDWFLSQSTQSIGVAAEAQPMTAKERKRLQLEAKWIKWDGLARGKFGNGAKMASSLDQQTIQSD